MSEATKPPFRAEHVGSLLRPAELLAAHQEVRAGRCDPAALRAIEDRCIRRIIALQESAGLRAVTDGELRRRSFHADFIEKIEGARSQGRLSVQGAVGGAPEETPVAGKPFAPRAFNVTAKLRHARPIEVDNFRFVRANTRRTAKQTMPSPTMLQRGGRAAVSREAYPDLAEYYADIAKVYREELRQLADAGCTYVQLDDTNFAFLCDPKLRDSFRQVGDNPDELPDRFARLINSSIAGRPAGMIVGIHLCRGNSAGRWAAEGDYEPVADVLLNRIDVDAYFLEYDDERSGGFEPLRFFPEKSHKKIVLGLVSTKVPALESKDGIKRRIDAAAKYVPLENLCLSPQCGFASTLQGNPISEDMQRRKLELVVEVAREVWGAAV